MSGRRDGVGSRSLGIPPWGFLGMIGLVAAIEWTLAGHDLAFTTPMHWDWRVTGKTATRTDRVFDKDLLIFGDSLAKFGIMPRVLKERSGKSAYNFALHTGQTSSSYFMLRRALRAGAKPTVVILELTPHMLAQGPMANETLWAELLSPGELLDLSFSMRDPDFFTSTFLAEFLSSYQVRHEIRASFRASLRGENSSRRAEIPRYRRNWKVNDGAQLFADGPPPKLNLDEWNNTLYSRWSPHRVNLFYLDRFLTLARSNNVAVYWLLPPIHPDVQTRTENSGFDADYTRFVREVQGKFPEVAILDARRSGFDPEQFMDGIHVNRRGAMRLSTMVADAILESTPTAPSPRWVMAGIGRAGVLDLPIEDVEQSGRAIQARSVRLTGDRKDVHR
ncbi:DUF1574 family protein [Tundrisphaera lichenicola]|uniref:DUF1574 family protein n=1 Tax=Tundrisphaera lichenicola TaxID=2029860 RepID=UPI003EB8161A